MNVEVGTEAAQIPEEEHITGIFVAVWLPTMLEGATFSRKFTAILA
jgi:hypothetical protein